MDLGAVMQAVADRIDTIPDLRVFAYPPGTVSPPAAIVTYPGTLTYDATYGRGMDRIPDLTVVLLVGKVSDRASRDLITKWAKGSGATSIKTVVESGTYTAFDTVRVTEATFDIISVAGVEHLAATFTLDIAGQGA
ncbi:hypothetical protein [Kribbella catacumbae]|uniref:hypothetical protein n=1 Tax=Kribbella catacumbae TaxID=460086 RepID=UPI0003A18BF6|nr:hypothetical protein [Kribbella catacumbae]